MAEEKKKKDIIWVEKYRPKTLLEGCYPKRIVEKFENGLYCNLILSGIQGAGKTTLARILCSGAQVLYINGSLENGVDVVREKIMQFCSLSSFENKPKIVYIDEFDMFSIPAQGGLRGTIEKFFKTAKFMFTCNYPEKIIDPIKSRCEHINFKWSDEEEKEQEANYIRRIVHIAKEEGLTIQSKEVIFELMKKFPDFRTIINMMQGVAQTSSVISLESLKVSAMGEVDEEFYNMLLTTSMPPDIYKYVKAKFMNKEHVAFTALGTSFLDWLQDDKIAKSQKVGDVAVVVHKYQYESQGVIDKLISLVACCTEINRVAR